MNSLLYVTACKVLPSSALTHLRTVWLCLQLTHVRKPQSLVVGGLGVSHACIVTTLNRRCSGLGSCVLWLLSGC